MRRAPAITLTIAIGALLVLLASACGSEDDTSSEATEPTEVATEASGAEATTTASSTETGGDASLKAPAEVAAGEQFDVAWTGPNADGDYITIVTAGATEWTDEPYFSTTGTSPQPLVAPLEAGSYTLWYVAGTIEEILARRPITVTPFQGALGAPVSVEAGTTFQVVWKGPDGPGDYVTIEKVGATEWSGESYFSTSDANPGTLVAPIEPGAYEIWYVTGADSATMATRPITVTPFEITLDAPDSVRRATRFEVAWTGPDGPRDYLTIVPAGSPEGTYASYAYTADGSPVTLTAPTTPGRYEIWYASDRVPGTFASIDITVN